MKSKRLQNLDRFLELPGDTASGTENLKPLADIVGGEIIGDGYSRVLKIVDDLDLFPYSEIKDIANHLREDLYKNWYFVTGGDDKYYDPNRFLFFDIETTGLSGGAGMVAFLIGFGYFENDYFKVVQYFLPDYPDEPFLLELISDHFEPDRVLVSYNGKSFDWPMMVQRWTINRFETPVITDHVDILHPARSLFRRLGEDCTLISLEKNLLAFDRGEDIPGYLIPSKYFDYLYDRQPGMIPEVIRHNRLDIISLALVTRHIPEFLVCPEKVNRPALLEGLVGHYFRNKRTNALVEYAGQIKSGYMEETSPICQLQYSLALKSQKCYEEASRIWKNVAATCQGPDIYQHLLELAKYREHRQKDPEAALEIVEVLTSLEMTSRRRQELKHRRDRLRRKCAQFPSKSL